MVKFEGCSEATQTLAAFGGVFLYLLIGALVGTIVYELFKNKDEKELLITLSVVFWPVAIMLGVVFAAVAWIFTPLWAATRGDLRETERRLSNKIEDSRLANDLSNSSWADDFYGDTPFKVGAIITGIVPQTDKYGEAMSYNILYQGCRCRVLSIDGAGRMKVVLIGHKDKDAHRSSIGETFNAPARNFTLVKEKAKKRKVVGKKKAKR